MDPHGGVDRVIAIRQADTGFEVGRAVACADNHHSLDSSGQGAVDDGLTVGIELGVIEMAVGVNHFKRASLQASTDRHVFEEAGEYGIAAFKRGRHDHALRFQAS